MRKLACQATVEIDESTAADRELASAVSHEGVFGRWEFSTIVAKHEIFNLTMPQDSDVIH
jgi:hypothetical protein